MKHAFTLPVLLLLAAGFSLCGQPSQAAEGGAAAPATPAAASAWPASREGLLFLWPNGNRMKSPCVALDAAGQAIYAYAPVARGQAVYGRNYEMVLRQGSFHAKGLGANLAKVVSQAKALSLEAYVTPSQTRPAALAQLISFSSGLQEFNFALAQKGDAFLLKLRTTAAPAATEPLDGWTTLFQRPEPGPFHLLISCGGGTLTAYVNGKPAHQSKFQGELTDWPARELVFGDGWEEKHPWAGRLEGIVLYARAVAADEAAKNAGCYLTLAAARSPVAAVRLRARLLHRSESKTNIEPYFRALALFEYKVEKVLSGTYEKPTIFVNHWTVMQKKRLPLATRPLQEECELLLEPMEAHPELESELQQDSLEWNYDQPVYYDVTEQQ